MTSSAHYSALSSWVLLIARAIDSYGLKSRQLFAEAGLDHYRLRDPLARFPYPAVVRLWQLAVDACGDPAFGLKVASFWHPTTLYALGYAWLASRNLDEAFNCAARYTRLVNTAASGIIQIESSPASYRVVLDGSHLKLNERPIEAATDAATGMLVRMCREAYGEHFDPLRVTLQHADPGGAERFVEFFRCPVAFSQTENAIWVDPDTAAESLATANPELVRVNDQIVTDYLARLDRDDIVMRVRSKLIEHLPSGGGDESMIASELNLSLRSLQRKLKERGVTFSGLLEATRRELGRDYVRDSQYSFNEISYLLGFTEPANFSRAFRRWYDKTPSEYRQQSPGRQAG
jgi:AraC-like DNA-binding protein